MTLIFLLSFPVVAILGAWYYGPYGWGYKEYDP